MIFWTGSARTAIDVGCVYEAYDSAPYSFEPLLTEELFLITAPDNWQGEIGPDGVALQCRSAQQNFRSCRWC